MKGTNKSLLLMIAALFVLALNMPAIAQDDLYYDPSTDTRPTQTTYDEDYDEPSKVTRRYDDDDEYYDEDDYAYEYSSRIRRFHRPARAIDYYDPFFVDLWYYDPFFLPGASIYTYGFNDYWTWRRWQRYQRWNAWNSPGFGFGYGFNTWSWGFNYGWGGYSPWNNPCVWNNYYYDPYWTWNGYNPYYGNGWVNDNYYYNNNGGSGNGNYRPQTYTGPRRHGSSVNPGYARLTNGSNNGRLLVGGKGVTEIDMRTTRPNSRTASDQKAPVKNDVERTNTNRRPTDISPTAKDPVQSTDRRRTDTRVEKPGDTDVRPSRETRPSRDVSPSRRPASEPQETRPSRDPATQPDTRPSRRNNDTYRRTEDRPSRSNDEVRPSRPSQDRPSRSGGGSGSIESRPSRSNDSGSSKMNSGSSGKSSSGSSGSSGRSSSGSSKSSSGSRGRGN